MKGKEELYQCPKCREILEPIMGINVQQYKGSRYRINCGDFKQYPRKKNRYDLYCYKCYLDKIEKDISILIKEKHGWNTIYKYIVFQDYGVTLTNAKGSLFFEDNAKVKIFLRLETKDKISVMMPVDLGDLESIKNGIVDCITIMPKERKTKHESQEREVAIKGTKWQRRKGKLAMAGMITACAEVGGLWFITAGLLYRLGMIGYGDLATWITMLGWFGWMGIIGLILHFYPDRPP